MSDRFDYDMIASYPEPRLWTDKTAEVSTDKVEKWIIKHQQEVVPRMDKLWAYYLGRNPKILSRPRSDPDNRTPFPYGRKIVNTFTGYAYRPGYISYRPAEPGDERYTNALMDIFDVSHETIRTERAGRNTAIFGAAYEMHYIEGQIGSDLGTKAVPRFMSVDPREVILIYDESPDPRKLYGIRYFMVEPRKYRVEVYTDTEVIKYDRTSDGGGEWRYIEVESYINFYQEVPITPYYMGDEMLGLIDPVTPILDDYDLIVSDSMVEFSRFANAYLRIVGATIGDPTGQNPNLSKMTMAQLKRSRVFDRLRDKDDVTFLTKDIPKDFIDFMTKLLKDQIHSQSHVPDFGSEKFSGALSGAAIERMLFDFENVVSSAEADFNLGLYDRISLVSRILEKAASIPTGQVDIFHRRNIPVDEGDSADVALKMRNAGISMETTLENMPREIVPDVQVELDRQKEESAMAIPDLDAMAPESEPDNDLDDEDRV